MYILGTYMKRCKRASGYWFILCTLQCYRIVPTCTALSKYVLFPQVRTDTYFFPQVHTKYVLPFKYVLGMY
jgi:hypothetical protein